MAIAESQPDARTRRVASDIVALARRFGPLTPGKDPVVGFLSVAAGFEIDDPHFHEMRRIYAGRPDPDIDAVEATIRRLRLPRSG